MQTPPGLQALLGHLDSTEKSVPCSSQDQTIPSLARSWAYMHQIQPPSYMWPYSVPTIVVLIPPLTACIFIAPGSVHLGSCYFLPLPSGVLHSPTLLSNGARGSLLPKETVFVFVSSTHQSAAISMKSRADQMHCGSFPPPPLPLNMECLHLKSTKLFQWWSRRGVKWHGR